MSQPELLQVFDAMLKQQLSKCDRKLEERDKQLEHTRKKGEVIKKKFRETRKKIIGRENTFGHIENPNRSKSRA